MDANRPTPAHPARRGRRVVVGAAALALLVAGCSSTTNDATTTGAPATTAPGSTTTGTAASLTPSTAGSGATSATGAAPTVAGATGPLVLDPTHDYGDPYADGILPVGDGRYSTAGAGDGNVYVCRAPAGGGGAFTRGPWFVNGNSEYDLNLKVNVQGSVSWDGNLDVQVADGRRRITTNDVPGDHDTGVFPVSASDPAYQYDRNPNTIREQTLTYDLNASPTYSDTPGCVAGEVGVMLTGVALFDAFDAGGRDAGAWETQDDCSGHPQEQGEYHYHTLSSCITDVDYDTVIGFALDGFPITGPKVGEGNVLTTDDLDECHGITSEIDLDGTRVTMYHYVMTQDFPYSASCFRATAVRPANR